MERTSEIERIWERGEEIEKEREGWREAVSEK